MRPPRSFPFGEEPAVLLTPSTKPPTQPLKQHRTAQLVDFAPPARVLPFREPLPTPVLPPAPLSPLVLPLAQPAPAQSRISFRTAASLVLLVLDVLVLGYLLATWRP